MVCVSATLPHEVLEMTGKFMTDPVRVLVKRDELTLEVRLKVNFNTSTLPPNDYPVQAPVRELRVSSRVGFTSNDKGLYPQTLSQLKRWPRTVNNWYAVLRLEIWPTLSRCGGGPPGWLSWLDDQSRLLCARRSLTAQVFSHSGSHSASRTAESRIRWHIIMV